MGTLKLAVRNLQRRWRRYVLVAVAAALGFAVITLISGAVYGSLDAIADKAARYFAGHVSVSAYVWGQAHTMTDPEGVMESLRDADLPLRCIAPRTVYYRSDARLLFNGQAVRQRRLVGIDFGAEGPEFSGLSFLSGGWEAMLGEPGRNGTLISATAARLLGCRLGDDITLTLNTDKGQYNAATLVVQGIFDETSLFGYIAYLRQEDLNRLTGRPDGTATDIALYSRGGADLDDVAYAAREALSGHYPVYPVFHTRAERDVALGAREKDERLAVLSLDAQLAQITQLLDALLAISYFTLVLFAAIVMAGVLNTYRVLVHERTREIGTMRALGMQRSRVRALFIVEAFALACISCVAGLAIGLILLRLASALDLSAVAGSGLFLEGGHLRIRLSAPALLLDGVLMCVAVLAAAWGPARKAGDIPPAEAMRTEE